MEAARRVDLLKVESDDESDEDAEDEEEQAAAGKLGCRWPTTAINSFRRVPFQVGGMRNAYLLSSDHSVSSEARKAEEEKQQMEEEQKRGGRRASVVGGYSCARSFTNMSGFIPTLSHTGMPLLAFFE